MQRHLISFADSKFKKSLERLKNQAEEMNCFDQIHMYSENDLDPEFINQFPSRFFNSKGFGYWCWKPYLVKKTFNKINSGDQVIYLDAGCHLNVNGKSLLLEYFDTAERHPSKMLTFTPIATEEFPDNYFMNAKRYHDRLWTKQAVKDHFKITEHKYLDTPTIGAGIFIVGKNKKNEDLINQWLQICTKHPYLIDDSPSKNKEEDTFIANRHDQSIFSYLCKGRKTALRSTYEYFYINRFGIRHWFAHQNYPIHVKRDLGFIEKNKRRYYWCLRKLKLRSK